VAPTWWAISLLLVAVVLFGLAMVAAAVLLPLRDLMEHTHLSLYQVPYLSALVTVHIPGAVCAE
jgi:hypothetical protein